MKKLLSILLFVPLALFGQTPPQVGDFVGGGIVFWVNPSNNYDMLVCDTSSMFEYTKWGCSDISIDTETYIGSGFQNTLNILSSCEEDSIAAKLCANLVSNGYDDWYLPSKDELNEIYLQSNSLNIVNRAYWSSSDFNGNGNNPMMTQGTNIFDNSIVLENLAWGQNIGSGWQGGYLKEGYTENYSAADGFVIPVRTLDFLSLVTDSIVAQHEIALQESIQVISLLQQALDSWNTTLNLGAGWNMFGYGCPSYINVADGLSNHTESIIITKDNNGNVYMPEFGFNGIGDFTPGYGYQIKLTEAIEGFSLCDWYVNDIPEDNIVSLQEENTYLQDSIGSLQSELDCYENPQIGDQCFGGIVFYVDEIGKDGLISLSQDEGLMSWSEGLSHSENLILHGYDDWFLPSIYQLEVLYENIGPTSIFEFNFAGNNHWSSSLEDSNALAYNFVSGSIEIIDDNSSNNTLRNILPIREFGKLQYGCMDSLACNYNPEAFMAGGSCEYSEDGYDCDGNVAAQIGDIFEGGYLFYIDKSGQHGLVAALEDLDLGELEWGCIGEWGGMELYGADYLAIGTGYQNTLDIVASCSETPIAASEALAYDGGGYNDWYLPSKDELLEIYNTLGYGGSEYNIGQYGLDYFQFYWSSSELDVSAAWSVRFTDGLTTFSYKYNANNVRVIRAF